MPHQQEFAFLKYNTELCNSGGIQFLLPKSFFSRKQPIQAAERKRTSNRDSLLCFNAKQTLLRRKLNPNDELLKVKHFRKPATDNFSNSPHEKSCFEPDFAHKKNEEQKNKPLTDFRLLLATNDVFLVFAVSPSILRNSIHL